MEDPRNAFEQESEFSEPAFLAKNPAVMYREVWSEDKQSLPRSLLGEFRRDPRPCNGSKGANEGGKLGGKILQRKNDRI